MTNLNEDFHFHNTYRWQTLLSMAKKHRASLIKANIMAMIAVLASVPVPLLMPLLVDEVLLKQPGVAVQTIQQITPTVWHGPVLYILALLLLTLLLRAISLFFNVLQRPLKKSLFKFVGIYYNVYLLSQ